MAIKSKIILLAKFLISTVSFSSIVYILTGITLDDEDVFLVNLNEVIEDGEEASVPRSKQTRQVTKASPAKQPRPGQRARRRRRSQQDSPSGSPAAKRKAGGDAVKMEGDDEEHEFDDDAANDDDGAGCSNWDNDDEQGTQSEVG